MNYTKIYNDLINRGKTRELKCYTERHHIIPVCMNGSNGPDNLVDLTPEEHYVAHQLLVKIYPKNRKLVRAAQMMIPSRPSNKLYGWLRRKFAKIQSESQTGIGNSQFGTRWIHNAQLEKSTKIDKQEDIPYGWEIGRTVIWNKPKKIKENKPKKIKENKPKKIKENKPIKIKENKQELANIKSKMQTRVWFEEYLQSEYPSINMFCKHSETISVVAMTRRFKKHIDGYELISTQGSHNLKDKLKLLSEIPITNPEELLAL